MKLTIELSEHEVKGIKAYMKDTDGNPKPSKADINQYIVGIVYGTIHAPQEAVSDYIAKYEADV